jgi:ABC-type polysaccharide transport system permease subunit
MDYGKLYYLFIEMQLGMFFAILLLSGVKSFTPLCSCFAVFLNEVKRGGLRNCERVNYLPNFISGIVYFCWLMCSFNGDASKTVIMDIAYISSPKTFCKRHHTWLQ